MKKELVPKEIVEYLSQYVISQENAKKCVAIALRNRYRRKNIKDLGVKEEVTPKNVLLVGATGVGKTEIARRVANITNAPFIKVEATKYTEVGYVGKDVESIIKDLVEFTLRKMQLERMENIKEMSLDSILKNIVPSVLEALALDEKHFDKVLNEIKDGIHDELYIMIDVKSEKSAPSIEIYTPNTAESEKNSGELQEALNNMVQGFASVKSQKKRMRVKSAIKHLIKLESDANIELADIVPDVIQMVEEEGIVFIDEIDKIASRGINTENGEISRQGVQRDLLPIVEGTTVMTKHGPVNTHNILFIASGAFSSCKPEDLMPELQGRFPVLVNLENLTKDDFIKILKDKNGNLISQYEALLEVDNIKLEFEEEAIESIAEIAIEMNDLVENLGARRLLTIMEEVLREIMFMAPNKSSKKVMVDKKTVENAMKAKRDKRNLKLHIL